MKIFVLGCNGLLGRYMTLYLSKNLNVIPLKRVDLDASKSSNDIIKSILNKHNICENDVVINCIGVIKGDVHKIGDYDTIKVNSIFPRDLANVCESINCHLIHVTTDCVYSGKKGNYIETDESDALDVYGKTKSLGEPNNCCVIRTSIIGDEVGQSKSLISWVKSRKDSTANGFLDHKWNGVTCLQLSKIVETIINTNSYWNGVRHVYSDVVNKYELLCIINKIYNLNITITPIQSGFPCNRDISSIYPNINPIMSIEKQIEELYKFNNIQ